jgi:hypothetical protein
MVAISTKSGIIHSIVNQKGDFMTKSELISLALHQIMVDVDNGDFTAIAELLESVPKAKLEGFLSEFFNSKEVL